MTDTFNERLRLIRIRRKRESTRFRDELRIIPRWLVWTCLALYVIALIIGMLVNLHGFQNNGQVFPGDESMRSEPALSYLALAGVITFAALAFSAMLFMLGYVYRDAKRRGMHAGLWTILVLILSSSTFFIGLIIYLLVREPLPFNCPKCSTSVNARFNFCPNCKYNLHPVCPACQHEVADDDKFCPYCAAELSQAPKPSTDVVPNSNPLP